MSTLPQDFIFRFSFPCHKSKEFPRNLTPDYLDETYSFPYWNRHDISSGFQNIAASNTANNKDSKASSQIRNPFFDIRMAWHPKGIIVTVILVGKTKPPVWDRSKLETSDGLRLCLDMRDVRDVHRGTRFCHKFLFIPNESNSKNVLPAAYWLPVHRAKAHPNPVDVSQFLLASNITSDGYQLSVLIPGKTLTGYDPKEYSRLGIHFSVYDNELGTFDLQHPAILPVEEDPSLWSVLELVENE